MRRFFVVLASRLFLVLAPSAAVLGLAYAAHPSRGMLGLGGALLIFAAGATTSHQIDGDRALMSESPWFQNGAAVLQAGFYTAYISSAAFLFVVHTPILFSGIVTANLFGWLFWRFRRRYVDAADERARPQLSQGA